MLFSGFIVKHIRKKPASVRIFHVDRKNSIQEKGPLALVKTALFLDVLAGNLTSVMRTRVDVPAKTASEALCVTEFLHAFVNECFQHVSNPLGLSL